MSIKKENTFFSRDEYRKVLYANDNWDLIVIGGGATGLGVGVDAASRGLKVLLLEQSDFAKGTSSRSTKLVHGGVRYLAQGNIKLVYEALRERGILYQNAPHLVKKLEFVIPCYHWFSLMKYYSGLKLYDWLSGSLSFGSSQYLSKKEVLNVLPGVKSEGLKGGIKYFDGQFDDARLAINLAQTMAERGGIPLNYFKVINLLKKSNGGIGGVEAVDLETNEKFVLNAKVVVNATGVFVDEILKMDSMEDHLVKPSQGVHVVVDHSFLKGNAALMIPKTSDGRVLFIVPWHQHLLIGTTDTPLTKSSLEPTALNQEIDFIIKTAKGYLSRELKRKDILSVFAGLRPLNAPKVNNNSTKEISREHKLLVSSSGLITITGGKWTTYRKMAEDTVDLVLKVGEFKPLVCVTKTLKIFGYSNTETGNLGWYGNAAECIKKIIKENPEWGKQIDHRFPYIKAQVIWAARHEMARTVEDVLARRLRVLFLNAKAAQDMSPEIALLMAHELQYDKDWERSQVEKFNRLVLQYLDKGTE